MKKGMKTIGMILLFLFVAMGFKTFAQDTAAAKMSFVDKEIQSKNFTFQAQYALPLNGRQIPLTTEYLLSVHNDSLISELPYFGRAFVAPINAQDNGLEFTSANFNYTTEKTKRGGYIITMKPQHEDKASGLILAVSKDGYATLQVHSVNRQQISFRGIIVKEKTK